MDEGRKEERKEDIEGGVEAGRASTTGVRRGEEGDGEDVAVLLVNKEINDGV